MPVPFRGDFDALQLRRFARRTKDGPQARRLLALAAVYDGQLIERVFDEDIFAYGSSAACRAADGTQKRSSRSKQNSMPDIAQARKASGWKRSPEGVFYGDDGTA